VSVPWRDVLLGIVWPGVRLDSASLTAIVAVFGTTISPYLFFWQASQEVADLRSDPLASALLHSPEAAREHLRRIKIDTYVGMAFPTRSR